MIGGWLSAGKVPTIVHAWVGGRVGLVDDARAAPRRGPPAPAPPARSRPGRACPRRRARRPASRAPPCRTCRPGTALDVGHRQPAVAEQRWRGRSPGRSPRSPTALSLAAIRTSRLPSRLVRVSSSIRLLLGEIVHPVEVGRDEEVGRRALLDLLGQRRARGVGRRDLGAGLLGVGGDRFVERVLQARGRKDEHSLILSLGRSDQRQAHEQRQDPAVELHRRSSLKRCVRWNTRMSALA